MHDLLGRQYRASDMHADWNFSLIEPPADIFLGFRGVPARARSEPFLRRQFRDNRLQDQVRETKAHTPAMLFDLDLKLDDQAHFTGSDQLYELGIDLLVDDLGTGANWRPVRVLRAGLSASHLIRESRDGGEGRTVPACGYREPTGR